MRTVWALARTGRDFVFGATGLVVNAALAPGFRGAVLRVGDRVRALDRARIVEVDGVAALAWDGSRFPDPSDAAVAVRLAGPDYARLTGVEAVSSPRGAPDDRKYGLDDTIEIALRFDDPVAVTGTPALAFTLGTATKEAAYAYGSGTRTLVFAYTVAAADTDADGIDVGTVAQAVTLDAGESVVGVATPLPVLYGDLDPAPFADHPVDGSRSKVAQPTLSVHGATAGEGDSTLAFTASLSFVATGAITANYATANGTATAGSDYTSTSGVLTIAAGTRVETIEVPILNDSLDEADETFTLTLSGVTAGVAVAAASAEAVIRDDDPATVSIAAPTKAGGGADAHLFEREAAASGGAFTVTTGAAVPADLTVTVEVLESGGDFVPEAGEGRQHVLIAAGTNSATFNPIRDDAVDEAHGTVTVSLAAGTGYAVSGTAASAAVAVRDDDVRGRAPIEFAVEPALAAVVEGDAPSLALAVRTVADGTFTESADLARAVPGFVAPQLRWGATTHVETEAADFTATISTTTLAAADFAPVTTADGTGLAVRRALTGVTTATDTEDEGLERFLVTLERVGGSDAVLRAAAHPGLPPGIASAARGSGFYRAAVAIRETPLSLAVADGELLEGETTTVTATMTPPRAAAVAVTVSLPSSRTEFVGENRTLSFLPNATASTGTVTVRATQNGADDGDATVTVTGTADAADVGAASAALRVVDDDPRPSGGAVLLETQMTIGHYNAATGESYKKYGYADISQFPGMLAFTAGALADRTFEFQGVEYTVSRLTLTTTTTVLAGEFVAKTSGGVALDVGNDSEVSLGLEVQRAPGGAAVMRRLRTGPDEIGPLADSTAWNAQVGNSVTVRVLDLGPAVYLDGEMTRAASGTLAGYWTVGGVPTGGLRPETFELADAAGNRVLYSIDRLLVSAGNRLQFSTTPDVPAGAVTLAVSRRGYVYENSLPDDTDEVFFTFPLTAAARSSVTGVDYQLALPGTNLAAERLTVDMKRVFLIPMAGAGAAAPPPPGVEEAASWVVTVAEACEYPGDNPGDPCETHATGFDNGGDSQGDGTPLGSVVGPSRIISTIDESVLGALKELRKFRRNAVRHRRDQPHDDCAGAVTFGLPWPFGFEVHGDHGSRTYWAQHSTPLGPDSSGSGARSAPTAGRPARSTGCAWCAPGTGRWRWTSPGRLSRRRTAARRG